MDKLQMIRKTKAYMEMLARSIDPTTQEAIEDSVLNKQEIKDAFLYIASLLDELLENDGEVVKVAVQEVVNIARPVEFNIDKIDMSRIQISEQPIQIDGFVRRINSQVDKSIMKTFKPSRLTEWLLSNGYLNKGKKPIVRNVTFYSITASSQNIGIIEQDKINADTGEISKAIVLTKTAQEFILDNLENIVGITEDIKSPTDSDDIKPPANAAEYNSLDMIGQKWTKGEEQKLIREFTEDKLPIKTIASMHHRKAGGIRARLKRLGLIEIAIWS